MIIDADQLLLLSPIIVTFLTAYLIAWIRQKIHKQSHLVMLSRPAILCIFAVSPLLIYGIVFLLSLIGGCSLHSFGGTCRVFGDQITEILSMLGLMGMLGIFITVPLSLVIQGGIMIQRWVKKAKSKTSEAVS